MRRWLTVIKPESAKAAQLEYENILLPLLTGSRIRLSAMHKVQNYEKIKQKKKPMSRKIQWFKKM